jgi:serine/threonine protein kinase
MSFDSQVSKLICPVCRRIYPNGVTELCSSDGALLEPTSDPSPLILQSKYKILGELGRGGWGMVYQAEHADLAKRFAVNLRN